MQLPIQSSPISRAVSTAFGGVTSGIQPSQTTKWQCYANGNLLGKVEIDWGHTEGDALWACNKWRGLCQRRCDKAIQFFYPFEYFFGGFGRR